MGVIANTANYHVEFDAGYLWITRKADLMTITVQQKGKGVAGHFRDCMRTHSVDKAAEVFGRLSEHAGNRWERIYKRDPGELD